MNGRFENILATVGRTPVVRLSELAPPGVELYAKLEAFNPLGSVKDRLALGIIEAAEAGGELKPGKPSSRPPAATPASALPWSAHKRATRWWS
jgi:cysteine synthase A